MTHQQLVEKLMKHGNDILDDLTPHDCEIWHMASGVCGEAGELMDAIKGRTIYRKDLDYDNIIEELGDLEIFLEGIRQKLRISREQVLLHNIDKLTKRYGEKYSNKAAIERKDKK
jgi:NTP pyrophosphatase (non-canonical NTP hydrolase)